MLTNEDKRNRQPLTPNQIAYCCEAWIVLCAKRQIELDLSEAANPSSKTRFSEKLGKVFLGANAYPGMGLDANTRMSPVACLAHELAHVERYQLGYRRPLDLPDVLLDEAEASIQASFNPGIGVVDREDLVEDARDRLILWLAIQQEEGEKS